MHPCPPSEHRARPLLGTLSVLLIALSVTGCTGVIGEPGGSVGDPNPDPTLRDPTTSCTDIEVGRSPLRRLTRDEYANTVRDLLGVSDDVAEETASRLGSDEKLGAFAANAVTPVTNLRVEQYATAAQTLAGTAVADLDALLAPCAPSTDGEDACATAFIERFGRRAYRRPLTAAETSSFFEVYTVGKSVEDFRFGIQVVVEAFLQSPNFLYHVELGAEADDTGALRVVDAWELASRLSYFLWSSMPDDTLLDAAETGALDDPAALAREAERMLDDPRAAATIATFHEQWLRIDDLDTLEKDATLFPSFDTTMRTAMRDETTRFADHVIREGDGRLETLFTASYSFLDGPLFELYGVDRPADHDPMTPVALDPTQRSGILTHASLLARQSHANQTSPVHRGKLIRESILCQPIAPPPPGVSTAVPEPSPDATTRERFAAHDSDPACAGCHVLMDPIGLGFESYDAIGAFRTMEGTRTIDATGEIVATRDVDGTFDGAVELSQLLSQSDEVRECVARQWFRFATRRIEGPADACSLGRVFGAFVESDFDVRALMLSIVTTDAFRYRRTTPTAEEME